MTGQCAELSVVRRPSGDEMEAYERLLTDAMAGDATLFARQDTVEAAWAIVDPLIQRARAEPCPYERGTWGPEEADRLVAGIGGWNTPTAGRGT
jgi:glucose-6-phosphate 1-dehydrogenase